MNDISQELMTPQEAARWFRRSVSWLRQQHDLVRLGNPGGQPLFHVRVCRAFTLGKMCGLSDDGLRRTQLRALAEACGVALEHVELPIREPHRPSAAEPASPTLCDTRQPMPHEYVHDRTAAAGA